jgi:hypothetical protein
MEREWVGELERWLQDRFAELCDTIGQPVPASGLRIHPTLGIEESKYFLLGLEAGFFLSDEYGFVQSELLPPLSGGNTGQKVCQLFWYDPPPPRLFRERVCQLSTASSLIIQRGWLTSHILLEPDYQDDRNISYGIDILIKSAGQTLVAVEVKRSAAELQKLITDLNACCKRGAHLKDDCGFPQNHPKYEFCASHKPPYFWAVAPDADVCLKMRYADASMELEQLTSLPPRSRLESP